MNHSKLLQLLAILLLAVAISPSFGQNTLSTKSITISIVNKRFDNAIKQIQEESKIKLCYNSDIIPKNKIVTVKAYHNRLDKVLVPLLASVNLQMKEINDQIIITRAPNTAPEENKATTASSKITTPNLQKTEILGKIVSILDTVYYTVRDTIVKTIYDTIKITVYDTKIIKQINKPAIAFVPKISVGLSGGVLYQFSKNLAYSPNSEYRPLFEKYENSGKNKYGYSIGGNVGVKNKRLELSAGIEFFKVIQNVNSNEMPKYYDKIDSFIISTSIRPNGIFYTYKVDTTTLGVNYDPFKATLTNSYLFIGFPVSLSYKIVQTGKIEIGLNVGFIYSRLISSKSFDVTLSNGNALLKNRAGESMAHDNIALTAGFEIDYPLTSHLYLSTSCRFRKNVTSSYQKFFPVEEKATYIYPGIAIKYMFK